METPPAATLVLGQVDRILADPRFAKSAILSRLLRFTVEETLAGRGDGLKEYVLGVEVCGRPSAYDPRTDPIVRVQTRELRRRLHDYYETAGRLDPIVIDIPKGRYVATFRDATQPPAQDVAGAERSPSRLRFQTVGQARGDSRSLPPDWWVSSRLSG